MLQFKLSLPPFVFLLVDLLLSIELLHPIIMFTFTLPGRLLYSLELWCFALSLPLFAVSTVHLVTSGTDASNPLSMFAVVAVTITVIGLTVWRLLELRRPPSRPGRVHPVRSAVIQH